MGRRAKPVVPLTDAQRRMAAENVGLVYQVLKERRTPPSFTEDALGAGMEGLIRAAKGFNPDAGFQFSTYAWKSIKRAISRECSHQMKITRGQFRVADSPSTLSPFRLCAAQIESVDMETRDDLMSLRMFLPLLEERPLKVITLYYGLGCEAMTLKQIAEEIGVVPERARQIRNESLAQLKRLVFP